MTGHHRPAARAAAAGAVVNVVLSILLVRPLGLVGVALGTFSATLLVDAWIVPRIACRAYGISLREYVRQVVVPLGMPAGGQLLVSVATRAVLKPNSLLEVTLASLPGLVVFVTLFVTCALSKAERHRWLSIFRDAGHGLRPRRAGVQA
jgi:O-antigen/teichoic acid export membrane protein